MKLTKGVACDIDANWRLINWKEGTSNMIVPTGE